MWAIQNKYTKNYVVAGKGKLNILTGDPHKASNFITEERAQNFLKFNMSNYPQNDWIIIDAKEKGISAEPTGRDGESVYRPTSFDSLNNDWMDKACELEHLSAELRQYADNLQIMHTEIEQEICDLYHYMEFFELDACKGFKAYKMMQDKLQKRRKIKDEIMIVDSFLASNLSSVRLKKVVEGLGTRQYTPRVLKELFAV